jgi:hypothetical protein
MYLQSVLAFVPAARALAVVIGLAMATYHRTAGLIVAGLGFPTMLSGGKDPEPGQGRASTRATRPSKSVASTRVELSGATVFITPVPSLCSHLRAPVFASSAKSRPFFVP